MNRSPHHLGLASGLCTLAVVFCVVSSLQAKLCKTWTGYVKAREGSCKSWETEIQPAASGVRFVFASSTTYQGDIQSPDCTSCSTGIERARFECDRLAAAVELPGEYEPWISDEDSNVVERFAALGADGPWFNLMGDLVAASLQGLLTPKGSFYLYNAIQFTEQGQDASFEVWTGTREDGITDLGGTCQAWTDGTSDNIGLQGNQLSNERRWTAINLKTCDFPGTLYCFQR